MKGEGGVKGGKVNLLPETENFSLDLLPPPPPLGMWFVYLAKCLRMQILPNRRDKSVKSSG